MVFVVLLGIAIVLILVGAIKALWWLLIIGAIAAVAGLAFGAARRTASRR